MFLYWGDLFYILVNMLMLWFIVILLLNYIVLFVGFGVFYYYDVCNNNCILGVILFDYVLWFSV